MTCKIQGCIHKEVGSFIAGELFKDTTKEENDELGKYCVLHAKERRALDIRNLLYDKEEMEEENEDGD
jgi:phosphoenolpyruvate synthase/pyruvate phosphate dikinase